MRKLAALVAILIICLFSQAVAQDSAENDLEGGFRLGKFYVTATMLASEIEIIQAFADAFEMSLITDDNYDDGVITDDDITGAQMVLAYTLWRMQFLVIPVCEAGLDEESFTEPSIEPLREETQLLLAELLAEANACVLIEDFAGVAEFADVTREAGYTTWLMDLAAQAEALAGIEPDEAEE